MILRLGMRRMDWLSVSERDWRNRGEKGRLRALEVRRWRGDVRARDEMECRKENMGGSR